MVKKVRMSKDATGKYFVRLVQDDGQGGELILHGKWTYNEAVANRMNKKLSEQL